MMYTMCVTFLYITTCIEKAYIILDLDAFLNANVLLSR